MSEPGPDSITTSLSTHSQRPTKKSRLTTTRPTSQQSAQISALFANPHREITTTSTTKPRTAQAPPELVANVQGSSAGAGSGEFHVYKASRRREYERLRIMDEEVEREMADRVFVERREEVRKREEERLERNRERRRKGKARKEKARKGGEEEEGKRKLGAARVGESKLVREDGGGGGGGEADTAERTEGDGHGENGDGEQGIVFHDDD